MERKDELRAVQRQELRSRIDRGLSEADCGKSADGELFTQRLLNDLDSGETKHKVD